MADVISVGAAGSCSGTMDISRLESGLETRVKTAQTFIDSEVIRLSEPMVPRREGILARSANVYSKVGEGIIRYRTPYARRWYYADEKVNFIGAPMRGPKWFERMKQRYKDDIKKGAAKILAG